MTFYIVIFFISLLNFFSLGYSYSETSGADSGRKNINNTTGTSSIRLSLKSLILLTSLRMLYPPLILMIIKVQFYGIIKR